MKFSALKTKLFSATPIYSLVFTRIAFGCLMIWQCYKFLSDDDLIYSHYIMDRVYFKYYGFGWVTPLSENITYGIFYFMTFLALLITIGAFYRIAIILFTLGFTYFFLLDKSLYLNHFYMVILYSALLCFMPAHRYFSVDAYLRPKIKSNFINFWPIFLLRFQTETILLYAGLVKINYDWLNLMPLKTWLDRGTSSGNQILDYLFKLEYSAVIGAYGTIILHLVGAPLLLWKRTRIYAFAIYCCFHFINSQTFDIGIFPWMTLAVTLIFFDPDWPAKLLRFVDNSKTLALETASTLKQNVIISFIIIWCAVQIFLPIRSVFYPGYVLWTHEGHDFSWRMKIQEVSGQTSFIVTDVNSEQEWKVHFEYTDTMHCEPDMILQYAHFLRKKWVDEGHSNVTVKARSTCSLNGRKPRIYVNPNVDLGKVERNLKHKNWIIQLDPQLR